MTLAAGRVVSILAWVLAIAMLLSNVAAAQQVRIAFIPKNLGNPFFDAVYAGVQRAAGELGFSTVEIGPPTADPASQIPFIQQQVAQNVDAIILSANDAHAVVPALQAAMRRGVKVVTVDADAAPEGRQAYIQPVDFTKIGEEQVKLLAELLGGRGEIAILSATTTAPNQNFWIEGMKVELAKPEYSGMKLVKIAYGDDEPQKSFRETEALLAGYPNLRGIIAPTTVGIAAGAQALETNRAADRVQLTGLGLPNQMRQYVKNGTVTAFQLWDPSQMGYAAVYLVKAMVDGFEPKPGLSFAAGDLGERAFGENNVVIAGPLTTFTAENIDQFDF
ncbi:sugar ABC transporter substrate-binding protein [Limnochorda pilosa]|uniref:Sugar ABC transporter substrate-binding protein n=2 Tax=Limnochorda pilosa TaxID=1555112 RepID=A0A0K2SH48_LIMPI|nr:sugar ABC transporter substrate-binding protein [Limnochorda pilosa]